MVGGAGDGDGNTADVELVSATSEYFDNLRKEYQKDCKQYRKPLECYQLAQFLEYRDKNYPRSAGLYTWLCDTKKHASSCLSLGFLHLRSKAATLPALVDPESLVIGETEVDVTAELARLQQVPPDARKAFQRFDQACTLGEAKGCHNAGLVLRGGGYGASKDLDRALAYFEKACASNEPNGCFFAALQHGNFKGDHKHTDKEKAFQLNKKACELGHYMGCVNASVMCKKGDGVPVDVEQAAEFKKEALRLKQ